MDIILIIFSFLFILQFFLHYKAKKRIENRMKYMYVVTNSIANYIGYLKKRDEIKKYKHIDKFLQIKIDEMNFLLNFYSFDDILLKKVKKNSENLKIETKKISNDLKKVSIDVNLLFMAFVRTNEVLFENTRIEITKGIKIRGKNYMRILIFFQIIKKIFSGFKDTDISSIKKEEEKLLYKNKFKIVY